MNKICKKFMTIALGTVIAASAFSFTGCNGIKLDGDFSSGAVSSNGGFVVQKGNYIYFINGVDDYSAENNGEVVQASLMRIATEDFNKGDFSSTETVVPSLMVAGDYSAGIYVYGDRVYYATPTNAKNTSGEVENSYLDFKSTKLDGTDTTSNYYFRATSNSAQYRYTEVDGVVYCLHVENDTKLYSFNTETKEDTLLVNNATSIIFDATSKESPVVYYTMDVVVDIDSDNAYAESYNQVYCVTADTQGVEVNDEKTSCSYTVNGKTYTFNKTYLEDNNDTFDSSDIETYPYVNLGKLVLDGKGTTNVSTQYNADGNAFTPSGYTYSILQADNGGIYYTKNYVDTTESTGDGGWLFYTANEDLTSEAWNAVTDNKSDKNAVIAYGTTDANSSSIFYVENNEHYYLYVSGTAIFRNKVAKDGSVAETVRIVNSASGATFVDIYKDGEFGYLYYSITGTNGYALYRAVYNGTTADYNVINKNEDYQARQILNIEYFSAWYAPEIINNKLVFVNTESIGGSTYQYVSVLDLTGKNGMMTNGELKVLNEEYEEVMTAITDMQSNHSALGSLMYYHFYSDAFTFPVFDGEDYYYEGTSNFYDSILAEAKDEGYSSTYLYSDLYQSEFAKVLAHEEGTLDDYTFTNDNGEYYGVRSYFYSYMGEFTEEDVEKLITLFSESSVLTLPEEDDELEAWQWALIIAGIVVGVAAIAAAVTIPLVIYFRKEKARKAAIESAKPGRRHRIQVDVTDDTSIDVYATGEENKEEDKAE